jgi:hypothetical protein
MKRIGLFFLVVVLTLSVAGCGSSHSVKKKITVSGQVAKITYQLSEIEDSKNLVPEHIRVGILAYLKKDLQTQGLLPGTGEQATRIVKISVLSYRMRSGFSRMMFGILAGKDGISTNVSVMDPVSGEVLGESEVSSYNLAAVGSEEDIARMQGEEIARYLSGIGR